MSGRSDAAGNPAVLATVRKRMPTTHAMKTTLPAIALLLTLAWVAPAQAMRCSGRLVSEGDHSVQVQRRCGEPYWIEAYTEWTVLGEDGPVEQRIEHPVEAWYYNFGPERLMRRLVFRDDRLVREDTLGYGFRRGGEDCNLDNLMRGMSTGEVFARCGEPESQNLRYRQAIVRDGLGNARKRLVRHEEWVYDPGRGRFLKLLVFDDGVLDAVERLDR